MSITDIFNTASSQKHTMNELELALRNIRIQLCGEFPKDKELASDSVVQSCLIGAIGAEQKQIDMALSTIDYHLNAINEALGCAYHPDYKNNEENW